MLAQHTSGLRSGAPSMHLHTHWEGWCELRGHPLLSLLPRGLKERPRTGDSRPGFQPRSPTMDDSDGASAPGPWAAGSRLLNAWEKGGGEVRGAPSRGCS